MIMGYNAKILLVELTLGMRRGRDAALSEGGRRLVGITSSETTMCKAETMIKLKGAENE